MFGKALSQELTGKDATVRVMVRDRSKCTLRGPNIEVVTGDIDKPETLPPVMEGVDTIFLSSPMDAHIGEREIRVIDAAKAAGVTHISKIYGAVKHEDDPLVATHRQAFDHLKASGISWSLVSPNSVMETGFVNQATTVRLMHALVGCSGHGKIGMVALKDVTEATAAILIKGGENGMNYEMTGPESIDMFDIADRFSEALGKSIVYIDKSVEDFGKMTVKFMKGMTPERLEIEVLCHLRAWRDGKADLVTDTVQKLTGRKPISVEEWVRMNKALYTKGMLPAFIAKWMRKNA